MSAPISMARVENEHDKELLRRRAVPHNYGWAVTERGIASKTDKGVLSTDADPETGEIVHSWS